MRTTVSPFVALGLLVAVASPSPAQQPTRYTLKGDSLAVYNLVGELRVEPGPAGDVVVELTRGGADAADLKIETGELRGRQTLRVIYDADVIVYSEWGRGWGNTTMRVRDDGTFGDGRDWRGGREVRITGRARGSAMEAYADLRVIVPAGKNVALHLGVGKASVTNVDGVISVAVSSADVSTDRTRGTLRVATGSGNVDMRAATGDVKAETGSGDVNATAIHGTLVKLGTGSGNVTVTDVQATGLKIETGSGDVRVSGAKGDDVSFETGSGDVDVALLAGFTSLSIETGSGDVTLSVPATIGAQVELDTGSGDIDLGGLTLTVRRVERDHIRGVIGDGKGRLSVETGSGNVRLVKS